MTNIPGSFPSGDPLDLASVRRAQVETALEDAEWALAGLREKYGEALAEASIEGRALLALEKAMPLLQALLTIAR